MILLAACPELSYAWWWQALVLLGFLSFVLLVGCGLVAAWERWQDHLEDR